MIELKQKEVLDDNLKVIIEKINGYNAKKQGFIIRDILTDEQAKQPYWLYITKGFLIMLINQGYVDIFATYNGYKNFVYMPKKEIKYLYDTHE